MAHLEKYTRTQLGHILKHDSRGKDKNGNYIKFGNKEIDTSRTHLNYNLVQRNDGLSDYEYIKQRAQRYLAKNVVKRENVNWVGSWVITLPESLKTASELDKKKFFSVAYDFLAKRYGRDNVVSAYVHNDETTPHLHSKITPVIFDLKKDKYRFSAKDMFNRMDLKSFHQDLSRRMQKEFGFDVGIYSEKKDKERVPNLSLNELKEKTKRANAQAGQAEDRVRQANELLERQIQEAKQLAEENTKLKRHNELLRQNMDNLSLKDRFIKGRAEEMTRKQEADFEGRLIRELNPEREANARLKKEKRQLEEKVREQEAEVKKLKQRNFQLDLENMKLKGLFKIFQKAFDRAKAMFKKHGLWKLFKQEYREANESEYKQFQEIRHNEELSGRKAPRIEAQELVGHRFDLDIGQDELSASNPYDLAQNEGEVDYEDIELDVVEYDDDWER